MSLAYVLVEGEVETTLVIQPGEPTATITVYERRGGVDVVPPESSVGRMVDGDFVYPDGTRLSLTADTLTWPEKSLLPGVVFVACPLPAVPTDPAPAPPPA